MPVPVPPQTGDQIVARSTLDRVFAGGCKRG